MAEDFWNMSIIIIYQLEIDNKQCGKKPIPSTLRIYQPISLSKTVDLSQYFILIHLFFQWFLSFHNPFLLVLIFVFFSNPTHFLRAIRITAAKSLTVRTAGCGIQHSFTIVFQIFHVDRKFHHYVSSFSFISRSNCYRQNISAIVKKRKRHSKKIRFFYYPVHGRLIFITREYELGLQPMIIA